MRSCSSSVSNKTFHTTSRNVIFYTFIRRYILLILMYTRFCCRILYYIEYNKLEYWNCLYTLFIYMKFMVGLHCTLENILLYCIETWFHRWNSCSLKRPKNIWQYYLHGVILAFFFSNSDTAFFCHLGICFILFWM